VRREEEESGEEGGGESGEEGGGWEFLNSSIYGGCLEDLPQTVILIFI